MKPIAIHDNKAGFTIRWLEYCTKNSIPFKIVNCYNNDIIEDLKECSALLWHWNYEYYQDYLFAKNLLVSIKALNIKVIPDFWTTIMFDDKIGQKYLLESHNIPIPETFIFYEKEAAINWVIKAEYPVVFKLRCGAGSQNVQLVSSPKDAGRIVKKAFSNGFGSHNKFQVLKDRFLALCRGKSKSSLKSFVKSIYRLVIHKFDEKVIRSEIGYVIFQEFLPDNSFDTRTIIIGDRCFAIMRYNRKNDFRASGSGFLDYSYTKIDPAIIRLSFEIASKLETSVLALDFLFNKQRNPVVTEISYGFAVEAYDKCPGYWDNKLIWHEGQQNLQYLIVSDLVTSLEDK